MLATLFDPTTGESAMRWSVRIAVIFYLLRVALMFRKSDRSAQPTALECWLWTIGCAAYVAHVCLAFEFIHDWSHGRAWTHTAEETKRLTGLRRGEGIWVNYAFTVAWLVDTGRLWLAHWHQVSSSRTWDVVIGVFFAFIVINATVVFGPAMYRYLAVPVALLLVIAWVRGQRTSPRETSNERQ